MPLRRRPSAGGSALPAGPCGGVCANRLPVFWAVWGLVSSSGGGVSEASAGAGMFWKLVQRTEGNVLSSGKGCVAVFHRQRDGFFPDPSAS